MDDQLTFRTPRGLARALDRRAKEQGVPRAHLVREALTAYLAETKPTSSHERKRRLEWFIGAARPRPMSDADEITRQVYEDNWRT